MQHRVSLPAKPLATDGDPSSDIPSDLPGRGNYGAIGPPPRRTSIPSSFGGQMSPSRKLSYGELHVIASCIDEERRKVRYVV